MATGSCAIILIFGLPGTIKKLRRRQRIPFYKLQVYENTCGCPHTTID